MWLAQQIKTENLADLQILPCIQNFTVNYQFLFLILNLLSF